MRDRTRSFPVSEYLDQNPTYCRVVAGLYMKPTEVQNTIHNNFLGKTMMKKIPFFWNPGEEKLPRQWKRPKMPRGHYRNRAYAIIQELFGPRHGYKFWDSHLLDGRTALLLNRALDLKKAFGRHKPKEWDFTIAILKDAGVWPPPKWWLVRRRLLHPSEFSTHHNTQK